jgi:hypothetical protein
MIVSVNSSAGHLVKFLQFTTTNLACNTILKLDLGVIAQHYYHPTKGPLEKA